MKKLKKSVKIKITLAMLLTSGAFFENNIPEEKEIMVKASANFVEASPSKEIANVRTEKTEIDIYAIESKYDGIANIPLKAMYYKTGDIEYFLLQDGNGSFYISFDKTLIDGNNYIGFVGYNDRLISTIDGNFEFSYEEIFNDSEIKMESERVAKKLFDETVFKF